MTYQWLTARSSMPVFTKRIENATSFIRITKPLSYYATSFVRVI
ncbi:MAG: hypothetical protein PUF08_08095 [Clostridiales bacterium]|nr:hypothetical protein [Clostridiales bacterium]